MLNEDGVVCIVISLSGISCEVQQGWYREYLVPYYEGGVFLWIFFFYHRTKEQHNEIKECHGNAYFR